MIRNNSIWAFRVGILTDVQAPKKYSKEDQKEIFEPSAMDMMRIAHEITL